MRIVTVSIPKDEPNYANELRDSFSSENELDDYVNEFVSEEVLPCLTIETREINYKEYFGR